MAITWFSTGADSAQCDKNRTITINPGTTTLVAADSGKSYKWFSGAVTINLPATAPGLVYTFLYQGPNAGGSLTINPVAADGIAAAGTSVVNKDLLMASSTIKKGDFVTIVSGAGATGITAWHVTVQRGTITKEA